MLVGDTKTGETQISSMPVAKHINENRFEAIEDNFFSNHKKNRNNRILKNPKFSDLHKDKENQDMFYCEKNNNINGEDCFMGNELCKTCMTLNQAYYNLKKNYLINGAGRVCTYRKGKMFCKGKFQRVKKERDIQYIIDLTCNGKIQCEPCRRMQENMQKYYEPDLYKAIILRDERLGY